MAKAIRITLSGAAVMAALCAFSSSLAADTYRGSCEHWKAAYQQHTARARGAAIGGDDARHDRESEKAAEARSRYLHCKEAGRKEQPTDRQRAEGDEALGLAIDLGLGVGLGHRGGGHGHGHGH